MQAFLSHSSDDKPLASNIYRLLRDEAVAVWFDRLELRPGDSLLKMIGEGISSSDFLLVLVTDNSMRSAWVEKEIAIALTQEINGKGPKVIPLLLKGCEIPAILADKYYVTIDEHTNGVREIIPAIFRDCYVFDIFLNAEELGYDEQKLQEELYEYTRTQYNNLRVRIDNRHFNANVMEIVDKATSLHATPQHVVAQIKHFARPFPIELPIYWVNLATLLGQLLNQVFSHYGKNMDAVKLAVDSLTRSLDLAQYIMCSRISGAVFAIHAYNLSILTLRRMFADSRTLRGTMTMSMSMRKILLERSAKSDRITTSHMWGLGETVAAEHSMPRYISQFYLGMTV